MHWTDQAILLNLRRHGEHGAVISLLSRDHGRVAGYVRGASGKAARGALQPGNRLLTTWQARLPDQLGAITWECLSANSALWLSDPKRLAALTSACALAELLLPEQQSHPAAFDGLAGLLENLGDDGWAALYVHWELGLLAELGFGLDLSNCAVTGQTTDLAFVSPRSGRAVSRAAAQPYLDKLLALPEFLLEKTAPKDADVLAGLRLTGYFLERLALGPHGKGVPAARSRLVARLQG